MNNTRHFIDLDDIDADTLKNILKKAHELKSQKMSPPQILKGLSLIMVFDKRSTRTRVSFEVAMKQLGGHTITMSMDEMQITGAESVEDTAKVLGRFVDAVMIRMSDHTRLCEFASYSDIPVINGLTDHSHPCQIMTDLMTIEEKLGSIEGKKIAWFGDYNNVTKTYIQVAEKFGFEFVISCPDDLIDVSELRANVTYVNDPQKAAHDADVIMTDTWVSMGQEGKSITKFEPYQVNAALMALAKDDAIFMHCMPIHRGEEVTEDVLQSPACVIYDEAENRLHAQKAILTWCLEETGVHV